MDPAMDPTDLDPQTLAGRTIVNVIEHDDGTFTLDTRTRLGLARSFHLYGFRESGVQKVGIERLPAVEGVA